MEGIVNYFIKVPRDKYILRKSRPIEKSIIHLSHANYISQSHYHKVQHSLLLTILFTENYRW